MIVKGGRMTYYLEPIIKRAVMLEIQVFIRIVCNFIKLFRKQIGLTPKEYRSRFYTVGFMKPK